MATKNAKEAYSVKVIGESESPIRGAIPKSIDALTQKPSKDTASLLYLAVKAQVELCCQTGDVPGALEAIKKYQEQEFTFSAPLNVFKRDAQNGGNPYIGAHCFFGGIRDAAKFLFPIFYEKASDRGKKPSKQHFRKFVLVRPNHVFLYRPDLNGEIVIDIDNIEGQQPTPEVKGFAKYEVVGSPLQFQFIVNVNPRGPFKDFLKDQTKMLEVIHQAANHGIGACRSAGYGMWRVVDTKIENGVAT